MAVLEGDYVDLCGLDLPLSLSLQLQLRDPKLSGALWSAKVSASGFSVSLYWPTAPAPENAKVKKSRRKRKCGKAKEHAISSASNLQGNVTTSSPSVLATLESSQSVVTPITAHSSPTKSPNFKSSVTHDSPCVGLAACSDAQYEVKMVFMESCTAALVIKVTGHQLWVEERNEGLSLTSFNAVIHFAVPSHLNLAVTPLLTT